jgi:putative zinc finger protein
VSGACARPVADGELLDWWAGELTPAECRRLEEHLLSCSECSSRSAAMGELANGVGALVREGALPIAVLPAVIERLHREGRRVREYRVAPGGGVQCTVGPEDDVVLARLVADLRGVSRLDLVSRVDDGPEERLADVPFDPAAGEVMFVPRADVLRARPAHVDRLRLLAVGPRGERLLGEYTFDHRPWPGW